MIIKSADDKSTDLDTLRTLLLHPGASSDTQERIEQEIRQLSSGIRGEQDAAYNIDFYYGPSRYWAVIHDLRLEHRGRVAQIDHLLINRFLEVWVCESKRFSEGIAINEHGEFSAFFKNRPYGVPSPLEQNRKHCAVLKAVCDDGAVALPRRLGFALKPDICSLVLVSKGARISRPKARVAGLGSILKVDQIKSRIDKDIDSSNNPLQMAKLIASDTLADFARRLADLHVPASFDWHARFGLSRAENRPTPEPTEPAEHTTAHTSADADSPAHHPAPGRKPTCTTCTAAVSDAVDQFCRVNTARFGGRVYCFGCQKAFPPQRRSAP